MTLKMRILLTLIALGVATATTAAPAPASPQISVSDHERIRFGGGRVAEMYAGHRPSATEDQRDWLVVKLGEVGMVVVSDDGQNEVMAIDRYGGVYINGDLYVKGEKLAPSKGTEPARAGFSKWLVLLLFVLSVITSTAISVGLRRR